MKLCKDVSLFPTFDLLFADSYSSTISVLFELHRSSNIAFIYLFSRLVVMEMFLLSMCNLYEL